MLNPAACLCSICVIFALCVSVCVYVCQPPDAGGGIKDALSPPEAAEPQHICDWSIILLQLYLFPPHLPLYFIIFSWSWWLNLTSFSPFYFVFFYRFTSVPLLVSLFTLSFLISVLPSLSFTAFCFLHALSLSQSTRIPPFLFIFLSFIPSIRIIFASLYIYCHTEGKIREAEMIYVWYKLSIEPHWFSA